MYNENELDPSTVNFQISSELRAYFPPHSETDSKTPRGIIDAYIFCPRAMRQAR